MKDGWFFNLAEEKLGYIGLSGLLIVLSEEIFIKTLELNRLV